MCNLSNSAHQLYFSYPIRPPHERHIKNAITHTVSGNVRQVLHTNRAKIKGELSLRTGWTYLLLKDGVGGGGRVVGSNTFKRMLPLEWTVPISCSFACDFHMYSRCARQTIPIPIPFHIYKFIVRCNGCWGLPRTAGDGSGDDKIAKS